MGLVVLNVIRLYSRLAVNLQNINLILTKSAKWSKADVRVFNYYLIIEKI